MFINNTVSLAQPCNGVLKLLDQKLHQHKKTKESLSTPRNYYNQYYHIQIYWSANANQTIMIRREQITCAHRASVNKLQRHHSHAEDAQSPFSCLVSMVKMRKSWVMRSYGNRSTLKKSQHTESKHKKVQKNAYLA